MSDAPNGAVINIDNTAKIKIDAKLNNINSLLTFLTLFINFLNHLKPWSFLQIKTKYPQSIFPI